MRGDAQEPERRCGTPGTSGHVTAKSSMRAGVCFINPASTHRKLCVLPREVSHGPSAMAEGRAIDPDPMGEVSRRHSRRSDTDTRGSPQGRTRNPPCRSKEQGTETLGLTGLRRVLCPLRRPERCEETIGMEIP